MLLYCAISGQELHRAPEVVPMWWSIEWEQAWCVQLMFSKSHLWQFIVCQRDQTKLLKFSVFVRILHVHVHASSSAQIQLQPAEFGWCLSLRVTDINLLLLVLVLLLSYVSDQWARLLLIDSGWKLSVCETKLSSCTDSDRDKRNKGLKTNLKILNESYDHAGRFFCLCFKSEQISSRLSVWMMYWLTVIRIDYTVFYHHGYYENASPSGVWRHFCSFTSLNLVFICH